MSDRVTLVKPAAALKEAYLPFYREWVESGEDMVPWVISRDPEDFDGMVRFLLEQESGAGVQDGWVTNSTYWLVTEEKRIVGAVNIRHSLTEHLFNCGGHIGYGIRPSDRRKGYATKLLSLALEEARKLGIDKALVVCDATNTASERTIRNNGGVEDESYIEEDGNVVKRYWIDL
ncbi:GNAT family N-acetyltransferase [Paenibacillus arenilitoris]|uniref:GNAT family N-acetyltransferase n=1 Tax=Paenibacillus arenilitoris TaxID=2772299 RepID=A0A927CLY9_9BACL|nr:GNAT family N-acetyltransferase [Paenibacillus arenilitoris]MBD2868286.1 GNAT family N-acetyltransferase [Paenibacillus arenilitoris]